MFLNCLYCKFGNTLQIIRAMEKLPGIMPAPKKVISAQRPPRFRASSVAAAHPAASRPATSKPEQALIGHRTNHKQARTSPDRPPDRPRASRKLARMSHRTNHEQATCAARRTTYKRACHKHITGKSPYHPVACPPFI